MSAKSKSKIKAKLFKTSSRRGLKESIDFIDSFLTEEEAEEFEFYYLGVVELFGKLVGTNEYQQLKIGSINPWDLLIRGVKGDIKEIIEGGKRH